jgi:organic hydroperoxide reductase OsmC/OhrA
MHPLPHCYTVNAAIRPDGDVPLSTVGVRVIESASPKEFDGPGNQWSPEGLLTAAVADCIALSFRAVALESKYAWHSLEVRTEGTVDRIDGTLRFTQFASHARLQTAPGGDAAQGSCLVSNSLTAERQLTTEVL